MTVAQTTQIKIIDNRLRSKRYAKRNKLKIKCRIEARKYPLLDCCEFCGSSENLEHAHFDYNYPEIFVTACKPCHEYIDRKKPKTYLYHNNLNSNLNNRINELDKFNEDPYEVVRNEIEKLWQNETGI